MLKKLITAETVGICVFIVCGVVLLFRFAERHASIKQEQIFAFSENFNSTVHIRVPQGGGFRFRLGMPFWIETNNLHFAGEISVFSGTQVVWEAELTPSNVSLASWSKQQNLRWVPVATDAKEGLPLVPMKEYGVSITVSNLAGCSLWLERFTRIGDRSVLKIFNNTPTNAF
jgi:hypothetical protein